MTALPRLALSVRQPWAHCLAMGWKPVENRSWRQPNPGLRFRGEFAIHASKGLTQDEYRDCADLCAALGFTCPPPADLARGGIVGVGTVVDIVKEHDSDWFFGPRALVIADARPVEFIPAAGALGFFEWKRGDPADVPPPARWMLPKAVPAKDVPLQGSLL